MPLPQFSPMPLGRVPEPFSHPDWLYEIKWDGFRAMLHSDKDGVRLVSRNGNIFKSFPGLCEGLARDLRGRRCVLDGEVVCLDRHGKPQFRDLLFRRVEPHFYAFDLLWDQHLSSDDEQERRKFRNGEDVRYLPLCDRKLRLRSVVPRTESGCSTAITSTAMARSCSGWRARTTSKGSSPSTRAAPTCRRRSRHG
jgi:bifunctional non-homologous end joining protein LigD